MPEFRNYFYVYKNFTVDDDYKTILLKNYFTQVRSVERPTYDDFIPTATIEPIGASVTQTNANGTVAVAAAAAPTLNVTDPGNDTTFSSANRFGEWPKRDINRGKIDEEPDSRLAKRLATELGENVSKSELSGMSANGLQGTDSVSGTYSFHKYE